MMKKSDALSGWVFIVAAAAATTFGLAACDSGGKGNDGGSANGGSPGTGGSTTGGSGGSTTGGSGGSTTGGSGGSATGGSGGRGGSGGSGGTTTGGTGGGTGGSGGSGGTAGRDGGTAGTGGGGSGGGGAAGRDGGTAGSGGMGGGAAALRVVEFMIPRAGAYPHDPAVDSKGAGWWTDQNNSYIGMWDPATNATKDWPTPTPNCGPHGLTPDDKDNIWYTGQRCGRVGKLDPTTGMITEYVVPGGGGPHTPVFHKGALWFTLQSGGRIGKIDPNAPPASAVQTWPIGSGPYGIWPSPTDGSLWVAMFPTNKLVQVNPDNPMMQKEVTLPRAGTRVRRLAVDKMGRVYYGDNAEGPLGRYDPNANPPAFKEWPSPAGDNAAPYGIAIGSDERVYYFQGMNSVAVFDPATERFETVRIPTSGSTVRHMMADLTRRRIWMGLNGPGIRHMAYIQLP